MARHEKKAHNVVRDTQTTNNVGKKKPARPVPNLIPIPAQTSVLKVPSRTKPEEPVMSQQDMNEICAKSANSALKDFASLFGSEDVFKGGDAKETTPEPSEGFKLSDHLPKKCKGVSFFDRLGEKLMTENNQNNLTCQYCGHESTCLTQFVGHQKQCGKETVPLHISKAIHVSSTRCQYCRQRCKSSSDLYTHLLTCVEAARSIKKEAENNEVTTEEYVTPETLVEPPVNIKTEEPHPMENRVFVWNNIEVPMDIEVDDSRYEFPEDKVPEDVSYDLSVRTQSPESENSYVSSEVVQSTVTTDKIPTHGNDISVAQHKRVFKCPHCSFWASTASRFHVHIVGHLNKKPFECSLCAYRSNWRWDITKHIKLKSVRDPAHESAKVLMTDETGRRNYTKYNKYLTEIHMSGDQSETSGGSGTRGKHYENRERISPSQFAAGGKAELPKLTRAPSSSDFSPLLRSSPLRPPPPLKAADSFFAKKRSNADKKTLWKCKKCNFRDPSHEKLLAHVKGHYKQPPQMEVSETERDEASVGGVVLQGHAPFRCGHCQQVSNWKHVIQRHCRLKHGGDIRVVIGNKNGTEKLETDDQIEEPDHVDLPQLGTFKCHKCPFSNDEHDEFELHLAGHLPRSDSIMKCYYCTYFVSQKEELYEHLKLHGVTEPEEFMMKILEKCVGETDAAKRYKCATCPYITNSKSQYLYHKQFHKPRGGQYTCSYCSYNVSKRHLLHQHLKVHGINVSPQKQNGEVIDLDEINDEIEEVNNGNDSFPDIPLVWVSKGGKFSKMFKCRYCPHVNLRKVNIQEHEKMHGTREKARGAEVEHHCGECNYICNNAGVLSAHSKVHQGLNGTVHCLVDPTKTDEEQINELSRFISHEEESETTDEMPEENVEGEEGSTIYFCSMCPARFLKEEEISVHVRFHGARLFYKCEYCNYAARQKPFLSAHTKVHTQCYQDRSRELQTVFSVCPEHPPPPLTNVPHQSEKIYVCSENDAEPRGSKPCKPINVPISGTELYQQRAEAQQKLQKPADPQFGTLMHGNPEFVYPTYLKNGRMKEKRYKCHKCPSAFEKREQYKIHLSLHGSKQRYKCDYCDYSVKYYANYVQHMKKHQMSTDALAARKSVDSPEEMENEEAEVCGTSEAADEQAAAVSQRRPSEPLKDSPNEDKKLYWCPSCPYTNHRKDAVDNHQKRHVSVSGFTSNFTCEHCDYSVPQAHFLRDHNKLHFSPNKMHQPDGFMVCEDMRLASRRLEESGDEAEDGADSIIFQDDSTNVNRFMPPLNEDILDRFNNNEGEKLFVNPENGELVDVRKGTDDSLMKIDEN